jgi:ubiquinone/menaquinone biosynthesis C-methylase UbiE
MASMVQFDTTFAEAYEKRSVPTLSRPFVPKAIDVAAPRPGESVVDLACGTGIVTRLIGPRIAPGGRVAGVDSDPAMIAVARSVALAPAGVRVEWHCASALDVPLETGTFDIALCVQGLQYFPDCVAGLSEARRIMKADGRLVAVVWSSLEACKGHHALIASLERRGLDAAAVRKAHWSVGPECLRRFATEAGFGGVDIRLHSAVVRFPSVKHFVEAVAAGSPSIRTAISGLPDNSRNDLFREFEHTLREHHDSEGFMFPLAYLVLLARP